MRKEKQTPKLLVWAEREEEIQLCEGISIDKSVYDIQEKRRYVLLLKGLIVYLINMGGIGVFMTALDMPFSEPIVHLVVFLTALLCAVLYRSYKAENLGYLIFFGIFVGLVFLFRTYINSGYYAILNDLQELSSIYLDAEGLQLYNEQIANRYLAVTIFLCFIGTLLNIILNNYVSRRMRYIVCGVIALSVNLIVLFMEQEPNAVYSIMMLGGLVMAYFIRGGQHFRLHRSDSVFTWRGPNRFQKKQRILKYAADWKSMAQAMLIAFVLVFGIVSTVMVVEPKEGYDASKVDHPLKKDAMENLSILLMFGASGFRDRYRNNGGLDSGRLGGVSYVKLNYQPDLRVIFAPYSRDVVYIPNFLGYTYVPYQNYWSMDEGTSAADSYENYMGTAVRDSYYKAEARALEDAYNMHLPYTAKAKMMIQNIAADFRDYTTYYSDHDYENLGYSKAREITFYPREEGNNTAVAPQSIDPALLEIPKENKAVIRAFCEEAGFGGSPQEIVEQVEAYFQENIPYTVKPGKTPKNEDFINYFLSVQRKGYCSFFASAAVLIFRYYGIPARYVEGYAISFEQILDSGELFEDGKQVTRAITPTMADYFDGYSELGETALIEIKPTDANAHAWVEIYDETYGWQVADVTPSSGLDEESDEDFWDVFDRWMGDGDQNAADGDEAQGGGFRISDGFVEKAAYGFLAIILLVISIFAARLTVPVMVYEVKYAKAEKNDKVIMAYQRKRRRVYRRNKKLPPSVNYREQLDALSEEGLLSLSEEEREEFRVILETCGFSNRNIPEETFEKARSWIRKMGKKTKS